MDDKVKLFLEATGQCTDIESEEYKVALNAARDIFGDKKKFNDRLKGFPDGWCGIGNIYLSDAVKDWVQERQKTFLGCNTFNNAVKIILHQYLGVTKSFKRGSAYTRGHAGKPFPKNFTLQLGRSEEDKQLKDALTKEFNPRPGIVLQKSTTVSQLLHDAYNGRTRTGKVRTRAKG